MNEDLIYRNANALFVVLHLALCGVFVWLARSRPPCDRVIKKLCWLVAAFFITGAATHLTNVYDLGPATPVQAWSFAARAAFVALLLPLLVRAIRGVRLLPTPAQYQERIRERDEALARKDMEARTRILFQKQLEERNAKLRELADEQKAQIERLHSQVTETEYLEMRRRLHAIRNA